MASRARANRRRPAAPKRERQRDRELSGRDPTLLLPPLRRQTRQASGGDFVQSCVRTTLTGLKAFSRAQPEERTRPVNLFATSFNRFSSNGTHTHKKPAPFPRGEPRRPRVWPKQQLSQGGSKQFRAVSRTPFVSSETVDSQKS